MATPGGSEKIPAFVSAGVQSGKTTDRPDNPKRGYMYYDEDRGYMLYWDYPRSKWLSIETIALTFGRAAIATQGLLYIADLLGYGALGGCMMPHDGTIVGASFINNSATVARQIGVGIDLIQTTMFTTVNGVGLSSALNIDFLATESLVIGVNGGTGASVNAVGVLFVKWR